MKMVGLGMILFLAGLLLTVIGLALIVSSRQGGDTPDPNPPQERLISPTIHPEGGTFTQPVEVTITCPEGKLQIGPLLASSPFTMTVSESQLVEAYATDPSGAKADSLPFTAYFTIEEESPEIPEGQYKLAQKVHDWIRETVPPSEWTKLPELEVSFRKAYDDVTTGNPMNWTIGRVQQELKARNSQIVSGSEEAWEEFSVRLKIVLDDLEQTRQILNVHQYVQAMLEVSIGIFHVRS